VAIPIDDPEQQRKARRHRTARHRAALDMHRSLMLVVPDRVKNPERVGGENVY